MNPILLKTLISLAASNNKPAASGTVGSDAHLKNRTVLFSDEATDIPEWGISGLPAMILGAAPQTCLFVGDLTANTPDADSPTSETSDDEAPDDTPSADTVSFSLTIKSPPEEGSRLSARTIVWKLTVPVSGYRDVQTTANSPSVRAPVIKTKIKLGGIKRDVEIGLLEMGGLEQPLLIGKDTLGDKFLIRPDRPEDAKSPKAPSVDLTPKPQGDSDHSNDTAQTDPSKAAKTDESNAQPATPQTPDTDATDQDSSAAQTDTPTAPNSNETGKTADAPQSDDTASPDTSANTNPPAASSSDDTTVTNAADPTSTSGAPNSGDTAQAESPAPETANAAPADPTDTTDAAGPSDTSSTTSTSTAETPTDDTTPTPKDAEGENNSTSQPNTAHSTADEDQKPAEPKPATSSETTPAG